MGGEAPTALDESWGRVAPKVAAAAGIKVVYGYLSHDDSKNMPSSLIRQYHREGVGVWLGWESTTGRPLLGTSAGKADATSAAAQMRAHYRAVGYQPRNRITIPFSCDQDISTGQLPKILTYYQAARGPLDKINADPSAYGEYDLIQYLAPHGFDRGQFQTYAWSNGRLSPHAALYQYLNGQTLGGASVDYDRLISAVLLGAWWPPGHPLDTPEGDAMPTVADIWAKRAKVTSPITGKALNSTVLSYLTATYQHIAQALVVARGNATLLADLVKRVAALQADVAAIKDGQAGTVHLDATKLPVTGSVTIGGSK